MINETKSTQKTHQFNGIVPVFTTCCERTKRKCCKKFWKVVVTQVLGKIAFKVTRK